MCSIGLSILIVFAAQPMDAQDSMDNLADEKVVHAQEAIGEPANNLVDTLANILVNQVQIAPGKLANNLVDNLLERMIRAPPLLNTYLDHEATLDKVTVGKPSHYENLPRRRNCRGTMMCSETMTLHTVAGDCVCCDKMLAIPAGALHSQDLLTWIPWAAPARVLEDTPARVLEDTEKTKRSLKKNVMPDEFGGPQKPQSGFMLFSNAERPRVMEKEKADCETKGEKLEVSKVAKKLGEMWKDLPEAQKKEYNDKALKDKEAYVAAEEAWKKTDKYKEFLKEQAKHKKKKADKKAKGAIEEAGMPKKPLAAYLIFGAEISAKVSEELKAANPDDKMNMKARANAVKAKWDALGEAGQKKYQDQAKAAREKYDIDLAKFKETDAWKDYEKQIDKNKKAKSEGDKLAKHGGIKQNKTKKRVKAKKKGNTTRKRALKSPSGKGMSKKVNTGNVTESRGEVNESNSDEDENDEEADEGEGSKEEGSDEEAEGEKEGGEK